MDLHIVNANARVPLWTHFLISTWEIKLLERPSSGQPSVASSLQRQPDGYTATLNDATATVSLDLTASATRDGRSFALLRIRQDLAVERPPDAEARLRPISWVKGRPDDALGLRKAVPQLHPLLGVTGTAVSLDVRFLDITDLYMAIHGTAPWFQVLNPLRGTERAVRVMAALEGHPLVWYVVVPQTVAGLAEIKSTVMVMPADYGAISYEYSLRGLQAPAHGISAGNVQSGAEILTRVLTEPISDDRYKQLLPGYVALRRSFKGPKDNLPPALHHFRSVITYTPTQGMLQPEYWDVPFGFERAISDEKTVLLLPLMNGGEGGILIQPELAGRIANVVQNIYSQGTTLFYERISVASPTLAAYSQSGGNVFTACSTNVDGIRGVLLVEPQYMNDHLRGEDRSLRLGKDVIPLLLRRRVKVISVGRRKGGWASKYLPAGNAGGLSVLPDDANYDQLLTYPLLAPLASAHPLIQYRYSRLTRNTADVAVSTILGSEDPATVDQPTIDIELKVVDAVEKDKKGGLTDEQIVRTVFAFQYNQDTSGGYFTHNFGMAGGQSFDSAKLTYRTFFHDALAIIG